MNAHLKVRPTTVRSCVSRTSMSERRKEPGATDCRSPTAALSAALSSSTCMSSMRRLIPVLPTMSNYQELVGQTVRRRRESLSSDFDSPWLGLLHLLQGDGQHAVAHRRPDIV